MARVIITKELERKINKKFKRESIKIFEHMYSLKENPKKGKFIGNVRRIAIKELKYKSYRFYFITDGTKTKLLGKIELDNLLIKFVRMSKKKNQQKIIDEIKEILKLHNEEAF